MSGKYGWWWWGKVEYSKVNLMMNRKSTQHEKNDATILVLNWITTQNYDIMIRFFYFFIFSGFLKKFDWFRFLRPTCQINFYFACTFLTSSCLGKTYFFQYLGRWINFELFRITGKTHTLWNPAVTQVSHDGISNLLRGKIIRNSVRLLPLMPISRLGGSYAGAIGQLNEG